jgi:hypothetical protein
MEAPWDFGGLCIVHSFIKYGSTSRESRPLTLQSHGLLGLEAERPLPVLSGEAPSRLLRASDVQLESFRPWRK